MTAQKTRLTLHIPHPLPYFAEVPHYLWGGQANYDSEGDCRHPTDREWTTLALCNREARTCIDIDRGDDGAWTVSGHEPETSRTVRFLAHRSGAVPLPDQAMNAGDADSDAHHERGLALAALVAREFEAPQLKPFDSHLFWGSWKWIGWFGSDFTWVGRWIMHSVVRGDPRAVPLCIDWLKQGTCDERQSQALRGALAAFTGDSFDNDAAWVQWYEGAPGQPGRKVAYPEPDLHAWLAELKAQYPG